MTRSHPSLQQHLLTRSDLARLQVPAADVLAWLADGSLEQIGALPGPGIGDPVFTVTTESLRQRLHERLAAAGKSDVVLAPLALRTFLQRALLPADTGSAADVAAGSGLEPARAAHAAPVEPSELANVLHEVLAAIERDGIPVMRALAGTADAADAAAAGNTADAATSLATGPSRSEPTDDDLHEECFDADHLAEALDALDGRDADEDRIANDSAEPAVRLPQPDTADPGAAAPAPAITPIDRVVPLAEPTATTPARPRAPTATAPSRPEPGSAAEEQRAPVAAPAPTTGVDDAPHLAAVVAVSTIVPAIEGGLARLANALGELRDTVAMAARREPPAPVTVAPVDVGPMVEVLQAQLALSARQGEHGRAALDRVAERLGDASAQLREGIADAAGAWRAATHALVVNGGAAAPTRVATADVAQPVAPRAHRPAAVLLGVSALLVAWSVLLWIRTGDARLSVVTLVGGNALACCWLAGRGRG
jgi:hypothetical protein